MLGKKSTASSSTAATAPWHLIRSRSFLWGDMALAWTEEAAKLVVPPRSCHYSIEGVSTVTVGLQVVPGVMEQFRAPC